MQRNLQEINDNSSSTHEMTELKLKVLLVALAVILLAGFLDAGGWGKGKGRGQRRARGRIRTRSRYRRRSSFNNRYHGHLDLPSSDNHGYNNDYGYDDDYEDDDSYRSSIIFGVIGGFLALYFLYWLIKTCYNPDEQSSQTELSRREDRCDRQEETVSEQELDRIRLLSSLQPFDESIRTNVLGTLHGDHKDIQNRLEEESTPSPPYESPQSFYNTAANTTEDDDVIKMTLQPEDSAENGPSTASTNDDTSLNLTVLAPSLENSTNSTNDKEKDTNDAPQEN